MSNFSPHKIVGSLPQTLEPNAIYFVRVGVGFDLYCVDQTGSIAHQINSPPSESWNNVTITSNYTANNLDRIFANTTSGAITVTVPDSGTFSVVDLIGNTPTTGFFTNNLTINPTAGQTIMGASSFVLNVGAIAVVFELFGTDWRLIN